MSWADEERDEVIEPRRVDALAERLAWTNAVAPPGRLIVENDAVLIEMPLAWSSPLAEAWRGLRRHWNLFQQAGASNDGKLAVHYAALDWAPERRFAPTWGLDILRALELLRIVMPPEQLALFAHPRPYVDLSGHVKLGFVEGEPRALDEQPALVAWVRDALAQLAPCEVDGENLRDLAVGYRAAGGSDHPPNHKATRHWDRIDRAAGWLAIGDLKRARTEALALPGGRLRSGLVVAAIEGDPRLLSAATASYFAWPQLVRLVEGRSPHDALEILRAGHPTELEHHLLFARLALDVGDPRGVRFDLLAPRQSTDVELVRGHALHLLAKRNAAAALPEIERWLELSPEDPAAHAALGRAMLALGHPEKARAAHDRAAQLGYLPSQFARTNLDRAAKQLRAVAGTEGYRELPVPEHLRELVPLLSQGRLLDAILWLTDRYEDPEARALLATCYEYASDPESALHVYEADDNRAGIARCLVALGRRDEAFARIGDDPALLDELRELTGEPSQRIAWSR